ncbi:unnamed protein product [Spirodela intermedia]|uniref:Uncharacterized protein n=2 Tax=Spirodela intermedia TaxID=51605 RepID=A0A7I8IQI9_SPIIN|nr:unnamed protein product [Spirodela intermedia]CAA6659270.1 unnamed protein product [Spirodela intermedia]CAA7395579.1 unnamed protein product [Spirodela intermedia]
MNWKKVIMINQWPKEVLERRSFLRLVNYYYKFIRSLSHIVVLLTKVLKKDQKWT